MPQDLTTVFGQIWDPQYEIQLQNMGQLDGTTHLYPNVIGDVYNRRLSSFGEMAPIGYNASDIPVSSIDYTQTPINLFPYAYKTVISEREMVGIDGITPNATTLQEEARTHALALARYKDYIILNSIFSNTAPYVQIPITVGYATGLNALKITEGRQQILGAGYMMDDIHMAVSTNNVNALNADQLYSNFFYNQKRPLNDQVARMPKNTLDYYDVNIRQLANRGINSIPFTAGVGTNKLYLLPMWGKDVITIAMSQAVPKTTFWYYPGQLRYEIITQLIIGCGVTQPGGVVLINADTDNTAN